MLNEIITVYSIIDDLLKAIGYSQDSQREISDAEITTTVITAAMFFDGNQQYCLQLHEKQSSCCQYVRKLGLVWLRDRSDPSNIKKKASIHY
ncbi:MAG: hypothetical protein V7L05_25760 [Nostoc sp.]